MRKASVLCLGFVCLLTGCGTAHFADRKTNPVIQDLSANFSETGSAWTLATTASRRVALMAYVKDAGSPSFRLLTCSEPPPDVGETFASAIAMQLGASVPTGVPGQNATVDAQLAKSVATAIAPLMVRTQGLQVLRDGNYSLCIDRMNGWLASDAAYIELKKETLRVALELMALEIPHLSNRVAPMAAPTVGVTIQDGTGGSRTVQGDSLGSTNVIITAPLAAKPASAPQ